MATVESTIPSLLLAHLAGLSLTPALPVAWPNVPFSPPADRRYLRASYVPNTVNQVTLGEAGKNRFLGLFQIDVFWPENTGEITPSEIAGKIAAHFKRGTVIAGDGVTIRIIRPPSVAQSLQTPPYLQIPVTVSYQIDAGNPA